MNRWQVNICFLVFTLFLMPSISSATTDYARQTGFECKECHVDAIGGGKLTKEGENYLDEMKIKGLYRPLTNIQKVIRFIIGYIHLFFCNNMVWNNTLCSPAPETGICFKRTSKGRAFSGMALHYNHGHYRHHAYHREDTGMEGLIYNKIWDPSLALKSSCF